MSKYLKIAAAALVFLFAAIQFVPAGFENPPTDPAKRLRAPDNVAAILDASCRDCHSNETVYPWYSRIQPSASFLAGHIRDGRRELNFSVWSDYEPRRQRKKLAEICEQVSSAEMPLPSYLWIHRSAALSAGQVKTLCDWSAEERARIVE